MAEVWAVGDAYESYVGRWSRRVAAEFLGWLSVSADSRWLDAGCGTGALTSTILAAAGPRAVVGLDPSRGFVSTARREVADARAAFVQADACAVPCASDRFDAVVGALMLNFVPDSAGAVGEFARVASAGGTVAAYVWDYADGMQLMRYFWDAATELDPSTADRDEGRRFPICRPDALRDAWTRAGLGDVDVLPIDVDTVFADFDDYWSPFLGGQGPAPSYAMSLSEADRDRLRDTIRARLPVAADGTIALIARAWAVRGTA